MAEGRRGLGRGLSALLGEEAAPAPAAGSAGGAQELPIELVQRNPDQPRRHFDEAELDDLAASVRERGVLQPILVRPAPGKPGEYQIVAGERRWRAAQRAGLRAVPALVRSLDDAAVLEIAIVENVQRADLNPLEEALGYRALIDRFGHTQERVSQIVGKSRPHVANTLGLLDLPAGVQDFVSSGQLSAGHARALKTTNDPIGLARRVVAEGLSVRQTEALARQPEKLETKSLTSIRPRARDADSEALERELSDALGVGVELVDRGGKGELRLRYETLEQLDELCRRLSEPMAGKGF